MYTGIVIGIRLTGTDFLPSVPCVGINSVNEPNSRLSSFKLREFEAVINNFKTCIPGMSCHCSIITVPKSVRANTGSIKQLPSHRYASRTSLQSTVNGALHCIENVCELVRDVGFLALGGAFEMRPDLDGRRRRRFVPKLDCPAWLVTNHAPPGTYCYV